MTPDGPVMISVAPLGARSLKKDNPNIPLTPKEIADDVIRCAQAGASIAHIHARDETGEPTQSLAVFREICDRVREKSDIVLQLSLGTKGFTVDQQLEPIVLNPAMASLPLGAFEGDDEHAKSEIFRMARAIRDQGVVPEMSVLNQPMMDGALALVADGAVPAPACFGLFFKDKPESMSAAAEKLLGLVAKLPADALWFVAKGYRYTLGIQAMAIEMGGHVRVGLEDSLLDFDQSRLAPGNAYLVERSVALIRALGREPATPAQARRITAFAAAVAS